MLYNSSEPCADPDVVFGAAYFITFRILSTFVILKLVVGTMTAAMQAEQLGYDNRQKFYEEIKMCGIIASQVNAHLQICARLAA